MQARTLPIVIALFFVPASQPAFAQSFRRGGTEFDAVRAVAIPAGKQYTAVVVEFFGHGLVRPDGRNLAVATRGGKELAPFRVLQVGPGDFCRAAFQVVEGQTDYEIFYGGEPLRDRPPPWTCRDGLLMETRKFRQCNLNKLDSVREAFDAAEPIGADYVEQVFHAGNPFSLTPAPFLSRYSGYMRLRETGTYGLFNSSQDCSFLTIDDELAAAAPGRHGPQRWATRGSRHDRRLTAGMHKFDYYHAAAGENAVTSAAWEINPQGEKPQNPKLIPPEVFNTHLIGRLPAGRVNLRVGGQVPDFQFELVGDAPLPDNPQPLLSVMFQDLSPKTLLLQGARLQWDFGDGQTSRLANPQHVYLRPGLYSVKLSIRRGIKSIETTNRIYIDRPRKPLGPKPLTLDDCLRIVADYDAAKLDAASARQLALVYDAKAAAPDAAKTRPEDYLAKAVSVGRAVLSDGSAAMGNDAELFKLIELLAPLARRRLGDSQAAFELWRDAAGRIEAADIKARCQLAAADVALNDLLLSAEAKPLLEAATKQLSKQDKGALASELHCLWGDYHAAVGDGAAARKEYAEAARLARGGESLSQRTARLGAHARSTEDFIREKQFDRAAAELAAWRRGFPEAMLDGYLPLMTARYWAARERYAQSIAQCERLQAVAPDSPYLDQLLFLAADGEMRLGRKDRALATLHALVKDHPGSPLVPTARKNIEILEGREKRD